MNNLTRITLAWELHEEGLSNVRIAKRVGRHREMTNGNPCGAIGLWLKSIEARGLPEFLEHYGRAKKGPREKRQVDPLVKRLVWKLREREHDRRKSLWDDCCGQKIAYFLKEEYGIKLSVTKIYD